MLQVQNFALGTVSTGYDASATSIALTSGHGARFPSAGPYRCVWWNKTDYPNPADDPNREIVEVTARSTDTLTIVRGMETADGGLAASTKNTSAKTYGFALVGTAHTEHLAAPQPDREVHFFDDFLYRADQLSSSDRWRAMIDNNHAMFNWLRDDSVPTALTTRQSGFMKLVSDSASSRSGYFQIIASFGTSGPIFTGGIMEHECLLWAPNEAVSDATNNYTLRIGLGLTNDSYNDISNGIWFEYNHSINTGQWRGVTRNASTSSNVDSSVAVSAGGEYRLRWRRNSAANSVEFFVNGTSIGTASTNIFADAVSCGLFVQIDRAAGTARRCLWIDWVNFRQTFDSR